MRFAEPNRYGGVIFSQEQLDRMPEYESATHGCKRCRKGFITFPEFGNKKFCSNVKCDWDDTKDDWEP